MYLVRALLYCIPGPQRFLPHKKITRIEWKVKTAGKKPSKVRACPLSVRVAVVFSNLGNDSANIRWIAEAMNRTAAPLPYGQSEISAAGLTTRPSSVVKPPRIVESPASLECEEWGTLQIGNNRLIIGLVKRVHVREEFFDSTTLRIRSESLNVIGRMAVPGGYCRTRDRFEMRRAG